MLKMMYEYLNNCASRGITFSKGATACTVITNTNRYYTMTSRLFQDGMSGGVTNIHAEHEMLQLLRQVADTAIMYLLLVDIDTGKVMLPCNYCINDILNSDPNNKMSLIVVPDKEIPILSIGTPVHASHNHDSNEIRTFTPGNSAGHSNHSGNAGDVQNMHTSVHSRNNENQGFITDSGKVENGHEETFLETLANPYDAANPTEMIPTIGANAFLDGGQSNAVQGGSVGTLSGNFSVKVQEQSASSDLLKSKLSALNSRVYDIDEDASDEESVAPRKKIFGIF